MTSRRGPLALAISVALLVGMGVGCSDDSPDSADPECEVSADCAASDQVCLQGQCIVRDTIECETTQDCPAGPYECLDARCKQLGLDAGGADTGPAPDSGPNPTPDVRPDTSPNDPQAPSVESISPTAGQAGVPVDTTIEVTFSEAMDPFTINFYAIGLRDANNRKVDTDIDYDETTNTATITPQEPLRPTQGYRIDVTDRARDVDSNGLDPEFEAMFYTAYDPPTELTEIAKTYAPVIYQGVSDTDASGANGDVPTTVNFDGNYNAADNGVHSRDDGVETTAHVYYSATESTQFYFLHYILYYPSRYDADTETRSEHDFAGAVVVVDKDSGDVLMVEGVQLLESAETTLAYKPSGSPISRPGGGLGNANLSEFGANKLEDDTHYPMYVPAGVHQTCNWFKSGANGRCLHSPETYLNDQGAGVVLRAGDNAQSFADAAENADSGQLEMTYTLVPIAETLWAHRASYDSDGLFEVPVTYDPVGSERPVGYRPAQPHVLPRRLQTDVSTSFGRMPFFWLPSSGEDNTGQWLLDPVYIMANRYNFGQSVTQTYCYNVYFDINRRGDDTVAGCVSN